MFITFADPNSDVLLFVPYTRRCRTRFKPYKAHTRHSRHFFPPKPVCASHAQAAVLNFGTAKSSHSRLFRGRYVSQRIPDAIQGALRLMSALIEEIPAQANRKPLWSAKWLAARDTSHSA
jgi:hypothetical protein